MLSTKRLVRGLCPPLLWQAARRAYRLLAPRRPPGHPGRVLTLDDLDAELARAVGAAAVSHDAFLAALDEIRLAYPPDLPPDPDSPEYRAAQMALYHRVSGRPAYRPETSEATPFDARHVEFPFPYFTRSCRIVGRQLVGIGLLIEALDLPPGGRVLEFGVGYGKTTIELAQMGFDVTAVDVYAPFLDLVVRRCRALGREVTPVRADMLEYRPAARFDRVVFSACFHHCSDPARMAARLADLVAPGGAVVFADEPVVDHFPVPWGLNLGGQALWAIRTNGWLELGFRTDYFLRLLARYGWGCEVRDAPGLPSPVFVARRR
ncbi:MAG: hypothetical protein C0501_22980 [Isosphaera sp.]|nr:hypothetical protein [Isosphaera sp.]